MLHDMSQPHFGQVWGWSPTLGKNEDLESPGTPECSELDIKGQNTSHWGVLGVVGKILKRRYRKCPRIGNSDIFSPSYGQKKGRESNWQFDSRPLKFGNRCLLDIRSERATWRWKDLDEGYNFGSRDPSRQSRVMAVQSSGSPVGIISGQFRDSISGLHFGSPGNLCHLDVGVAERRRVYYREYGGGILPRSGPWCVSWSKMPVACPNTQGCPEC
jgi:hypothetical protein